MNRKALLRIVLIAIAVAAVAIASWARDGRDARSTFDSGSPATTVAMQR